MSYCRFENTYRDLLDCYHNMNSDKSDDERAYMRRLVDVCKDIIEEYELIKMSQYDEEDCDDDVFTVFDLTKMSDDNKEDHDEDDKEEGLGITLLI